MVARLGAEHRAQPRIVAWCSMSVRSDRRPQRETSGAWKGRRARSPRPCTDIRSSSWPAMRPTVSKYFAMPGRSRGNRAERASTRRSLPAG